MSINRDLFGIPKSPQSGFSVLHLQNVTALDSHLYPKFDTIVTYTGDAITYIKDASGTTGDQIKINRPGMYAVSVTASLSGAGAGLVYFGIARNAPLDLNWSALTQQTYLLANANSAGDAPGTACVTTFFDSNDVITFAVQAASGATVSTAGAWHATVALVSA